MRNITILKHFRITAILVIIILSLSTFNLIGIQVAVDELKIDKKINFINYEGPYTYQDTIWGIKSIGTGLAEGIKPLQPGKRFQYKMKYTIIHAINDASQDLYDADILSIDPDAKVDNIKNIRLILAGYLERIYGYSANDAAILATFITYYNAVYRGQIDYIGQKYKDIVLNNINTDNAGLSTIYYEWPGKTKILIPLTNEIRKGNLSTLDTEELTNNNVIDNLKKEDDKAIDDRKKIVEFKEKEVDKTKKEIEKEKTDINNQKKEIEKKEENIAKEKEKLKEITDEKTKQTKTEEIKKKEDQLTAKKEEVKKKEETVTKKQNEVVKKQENIVKEKEAIKKDEKEVAINKNPDNVKKELIEKDNQLKEKEKELAKKEEELKTKEETIKNIKQDENILGNKLYYLKVKEFMTGGHYNNEMFLIDTKSKKIILSSPVKNICGRKYDIFKDGVVVITYPKDHAAEHNLTLLNVNNLEAIITGKDNIFWRSFVEVRSDNIYAIVKEKESYYLAKFNTKLELIAKSTEEVDGDTFISFFEGFIYINSKSQNILILKEEDLILSDKIIP